MYKTHFFIFFLVGSYFLGSSLYGQIPKDVLFVGNSYTYFWNLPQQVAVMAESNDMALRTRQSTSGGTSLSQHWRGEKELRSLEIIREGKYDAVVLQDHSRQALDKPDTLIYYGQQFANEITSRGGRVFLYMTWAREWDPYMQAIWSIREIFDNQQFTDIANNLNK